MGAVLACAARTAGLSIRANRVPMVVLWGLAGVTLALYHFVPAVAESFSPLLEWEQTYGWRAAVVNRVVFTGIVPGVFLLSIRELRPQHPFVTLALQVAWCGMWGVLCDCMYVWVDCWFGAGMDTITVVLKVLFDQLPWTILVVMPANAVFYFWLGRDFSIRRMRTEWPKSFWREQILPMLLANWCVWIPVSAAVFLFPLPLRVHLNGFAAAFWTLACLHLGSRSKC